MSRANLFSCIAFRLLSLSEHLKKTNGVDFRGHIQSWECVWLHIKSVKCDGILQLGLNNRWHKIQYKEWHLRQIQVIEACIVNRGLQRHNTGKENSLIESDSQGSKGLFFLPQTNNKWGIEFVIYT